MNKAKIEGSIMDVISKEEYFKNPSYYNNYNTAIENNGTIYPVRKGNTMNNVGFYDRGCMARFVDPVEEKLDGYSTSNMIDFNNSKNINDMIEKTMELNSMEYEILSTVDNVFVPKIADDDSLEMKAFKQAVIDKEMDIDKYSARLGDNSNNDKKLFKGGKITLAKMKSIGNALDIKIELTLSNKGDNIANPMKQPITVVLNDDAGDEE